MQLTDCFYLGTIKKPVGQTGELNVKLDTDNPEQYKKLESVFVEIHQKLVPFFIDCIQIGKDTARVLFEDINTHEKAEELTGHDIYLPLSMLPPLEGNKFYYHEVVGFKIVDMTEGEIGDIDEVLEYPRQAIFKVNHKDKEVLIPIADHIIVKVDRDKKEILVDLPEGLLEVYL